jgi:Carbohydrate family 9 binding domain-like
MPWHINPKATGVRVRVDTGNLVREIYEGNNKAEGKLADLPEGPRPLRPIYIPEWYRDQQKGPVPTFTAAYVDKITVDGWLDDPAWQKVERIGPLKTNDNETAEKPTHVRLAYGRDAFYVAVEATEPRMDLLVAKAKGQDSAGVFGDDSIEVFIDSKFDKMNYYQFAANTAGATIEGQFYNFTLYNEPWECRVQTGKDSWVAEVRIPFTSVKANPRPGSTWGVNVYRTAMTFTMPESVKDREKGWKHMEQIALSPVFTGYHQVGRFAAVTFGPKQ